MIQTLDHGSILAAPVTKDLQNTGIIKLLLIGHSCSADAWQIASNNITDKDNAILVMPKGGGCSASTKLNAGSGYGFKYVLVYSLEDGDIYDLDYNALQPNPPYYSMFKLHFFGCLRVQITDLDRCLPQCSRWPDSCRRS